MANYLLKNHIAVIAICNPPVNALARSVRAKLYDLVKKAISDSDVEGIVVCGSNGIFSAGADISEFSNNKAGLFPTIYDIVMQLESSNKVTLAVIDGIAFGGGLKLALGCHYRLSSTNARFSFPEVKLGILPGAGGTQRFPRVVHLIEAAKWITSGQEHSAYQAHEIGLIDYFLTNNLLDKSMNFIKEIINQSQNLDNRRISKLAVKCGDNIESEIVSQSKVLGKKFRGAVAPLVCWHAVLCGSYATYDQGVLFEKKGTNMLINSDQSKALIHAFFSERMSNKWKLRGEFDFRSQTPLPIKSVGVVGLGTMGRGIVITFLINGFCVYAMKQNKYALDQGINYIRKVLGKEKSNDNKMDFLSSLLVPVNLYSGLQDVDLVIECVYESMELKKKILRRLDAVCKPSTILATNTSTLDIDQLAHATSRPEKVVGMHFFAPAHLMSLLENIYGKMTSPEILSTVMHVGKAIGKNSVLVGNCHGFVGNRMYATYVAESDFMLEEGASPQEIDTVLCKYGFPMGRYQVSDLSGNDVGYKIKESKGLTKKQQPPGTSETIRHVHTGRRIVKLSELFATMDFHGTVQNGRSLREGKTSFNVCKLSCNFLVPDDHGFLCLARFDLPIPYADVTQDPDEMSFLEQGWWN